MNDEAPDEEIIAMILFVCLLVFLFTPTGRR
jgi:hypothetical protein